MAQCSLHITLQHVEAKMHWPSSSSLTTRAWPWYEHRFSLARETDPKGVGDHELWLCFTSKHLFHESNESQPRTAKSVASSNPRLGSSSAVPVASSAVPGAAQELQFADLADCFGVKQRFLIWISSASLDDWTWLIEWFSDSTWVIDWLIGSVTLLIESKVAQKWLQCNA